MLKNDIWIKKKCNSSTPLITPFEDKKISTNINHKILSFGLNSFGYDLTLDSNISIFKNSDDFIDPKDFEIELKQLPVYDFMETIEAEKFVLLPPKTFALAHTKEIISMPKKCIGLVTCKSTYARCGLNLNNTTIQAGWKGQLVLELFNQTDNPIKLYINEGICQVIFLEGELPEITYNGVYQDQKNITLPKV